MIRVLLADDHTLVREVLANSLRGAGDCVVVAQAGDGLAAIEQALAKRPDVAVVDLSMPRLNGVEVIRRLAHDLPRTRVLVVTMHEEDEYVVHAVRAGAAGYLVKHSPACELINAVRALAAGGVYFGADASKVLAEHIHHPSAFNEDPYGTLSPREREVFHLMVDGRTTKEIAHGLDISPKTAEHHRSHVLDKLCVRNSTEVVRYAQRKRLIQ
jgi:DNA-binding NarL/FixJ family response regulator